MQQGALMDEVLLQHGSLVLVFVWLVAGGLGLPLPEDPAVLAAGALAYHGVVSPALAGVVVLAGVLGGDLMLFTFAKRLGPAAYEHRVFRRILTPNRRKWLEEQYERRGGVIVFTARHIIGVRAATFAFAGIHGMSTRRFLTWDGLAACISVPVVFAVGYFGAMHIDRVRKDVAVVEHIILLVALAVAIAYAASRIATRYRKPAP